MIKLKFIIFKVDFKFFTKQNDKKVNKIILLVGIILWLVVNILLTQYSSGSTTLLTLLGFKHAHCWPSWVGSFYHPSLFTVVHLCSGLTQTISSTTLSIRFLFFFIFIFPNTASPTYRIRNCPGIIYWEFRLVFSQRQ